MNCQAVPGAARRWEHRLCAAEANCTVNFKGINVPVCHVHKGVYTRQANIFAAEAMARRDWGWTFSALLDVVA